MSEKFVKLEDVIELIKHRINSFKSHINEYELSDFKSIEDITIKVEALIGIAVHDVEEHMEHFIFENEK